MHTNNIKACACAGQMHCKMGNSACSVEPPRLSSPPPPPSHAPPPYALPPKETLKRKRGEEPEEEPEQSKQRRVMATEYMKEWSAMLMKEQCEVVRSDFNSFQPFLKLNAKQQKDAIIQMEKEFDEFQAFLDMNPQDRAKVRVEREQNGYSNINFPIEFEYEKKKTLVLCVRRVTLFGHTVFFLPVGFRWE